MDIIHALQLATCSDLLFHQPIADKWLDVIRPIVLILTIVFSIQVYEGLPKLMKRSKKNPDWVVLYLVILYNLETFASLSLWWNEINYIWTVMGLYLHLGVFSGIALWVLVSDTEDEKELVPIPLRWFIKEQEK